MASAPPLPPPPTAAKTVPPPATGPQPPVVVAKGPAGAPGRAVDLQWPSLQGSLGVLGMVSNSKRNHNFDLTQKLPSTRIPLQWVDGQWFDEAAMLNNGTHKTDKAPVCGFEASVYKVKAPEKSLNTTDDKSAPVGKKVNQKNCQTWIVESTDQLVKDHIFSNDTAGFLHAIQQ